MPAPNGPQFIRLYRGLANVTPEEVSTKELGPHWTSDPRIATNFATNRDVEGNPHWDLEDTPMAGTVVEALIHKRHIIDPSSEEGHDWAMGEAVLGPDHPEREKTVRPNALVHIEKMHYLDDDAGTTKTVNVPRSRKTTGRA